MHDDWVIFGLYPQVVRTALDRILDGSPETDSILANPDFVRGRKLTGPPGAGVFYTNTKAGAEQAYSFVLPLAQVGAAMAQGEMSLQASWDEESKANLKNDITEILLWGKATDAETGYVLLQYRFANWAACADRNEADTAGPF